MQKFTEGDDFYYNEQGNVVFTHKYLLERGFCCGNGCKHCPYNVMNISATNELLSLKKDEKEQQNSIEK